MAESDKDKPEHPEHPHGGAPGQTGEHPQGGPPGQDKPDEETEEEDQPHVEHHEDKP